MEHLTGGASPESSGDNNTLSHPGGSQRHPTSGSSDNSQLPTRHVGGPVFDRHQLYVQASPRLSLGGVLEYGIHVCEYGRYVSGPEA